jgi:ABC-2 type transport system permease protein
MYNLIFADLFKLRKSIAIKILFGITTISAVAMAVIAYLIPQGKLDSSMSGIGFLFSDVNIMTILGGVVAGIFICGDFDNKTINQAVASGYGRSTLLISKMFVFFFAIVLLLIPYIIVTGIAISIGYKFNMGVGLCFLNLLTQEAGKTFSVLEIWKLLVIMITLILVYLAQLSICVPLSFALKKPVLVVSICYGIQILYPQLIGIGSIYPVIHDVLNYFPYGEPFIFLTLITKSGDILRTAFLSVIFIILMISITSFVFRKSEIK